MRLLLFVGVYCICISAYGQPGHFINECFNTSDFVVQGRFIKADTLNVMVFNSPEAGPAVSPAMFSRDSTERTVFARNKQAESKKNDSIRVAHEKELADAERKAQAREVKRKRGKVYAQSPPDPPRIWACRQYKIFRYSYRVDILYESRYVYSNQLRQAEMKSGDVISLMVMADQLKPEQCRELEQQELIIYFNETYFNQHVPAAFGTYDLMRFYSKERMYWIDPDRVRRVVVDFDQK